MPKDLNSDSEHARRTESVETKEDTWHQGQRVTIKFKKNVSGKHGAYWRPYYNS